jgi:hypothetical protein
MDSRSRINTLIGLKYQVMKYLTCIHFIVFSYQTFHTSFLLHSKSMHKYYNANNLKVTCVKIARTNVLFSNCMDEINILSFAALACHYISLHAIFRITFLIELIRSSAGCKIWFSSEDFRSEARLFSLNLSSQLSCISFEQPSNF